MSEPLEKLHADALAEVVKRLRESPAVAALVPAQVFGPGDAGAGEWARCVVVTPGRRYGGTPGTVALLVPRDAKVEMRAESRDVLNLLAVAVVRALNGAAGKGGFQHCIHTNSTPSQDGPGDPPAYVSRADTFGLHAVQPKAAPTAESAPPAPPKITPPAAPPRLKSEE